MRVALGSDHAGFHLKSRAAQWLGELGHEVQDAGPATAEPCDYPDYAARVARLVAAGAADAGLLVCGTGTGMAMAANKVPGIRAAACTNGYLARQARAHNDANVLCLGERVLGDGLAREITEIFFATAFEGGRHAGRVGKITALDRR